MADPVSIVSAAGTALQGVSSMIGSIGAGKRAKKIIGYQEQSQKNLMDYQNAINIANTEDERAYNEDWTQRYFDTYESLSARRADAEKAGFNPEAVLGNSSGAGSATSAGSPGGVSVPGAPAYEDPRSAENITKGLGSMLSAVGSISQLVHDKKMRDAEELAASQDAEARGLELEKQKYENDLLKNAWSRIQKDNDYTDWSRDRDRDAWRFQHRVDQWNFQRSIDRAFDEDVAAMDAHDIAELQKKFYRGQINNENWMYEYRKANGKNPPSNMTFPEFLANLLLGDNAPATADRIGENVGRSILELPKGFVRGSWNFGSDLYKGFKNWVREFNEHNRRRRGSR